MAFVVIEHTPGYMPEDTDPFVTEDFGEARTYANELADQLEEEGYVCTRAFTSGADHYSILCSRAGAHDLGRYIAVEQASE